MNILLYVQIVGELVHGIVQGFSGMFALSYLLIRSRNLPSQMTNALIPPRKGGIARNMQLLSLASKSCGT
jgi:hypothetical protein